MFLPVVYLILAYLSLMATVVCARPVCGKNDDGSVTLHTVHQSTAGDCVVVETCDITLTPTSDHTAQKPAYVEVRRCTVAVTTVGQSDSGQPAVPSISVSSTTTTVTSPSIPPSSLPTPASTNTPDPETTLQPSNTSPTASPLPADENKPPPEKATPTAKASGSNASPLDSSASAAAAFQLPGKKLSVLPIGLGIFAGISVIAMIVVGLVTYERTKYRKAFRQRKLAEAGATMGYGGMAQRPF